MHLCMLVGVVVNNAIVLIDYTDILRKTEGLSAREALLTLVLIPVMYLMIDGAGRKKAVTNA